MKKHIFIFLVLFILFTSIFIAMGADKEGGPAHGLNKHQKAGLTCTDCHSETPPSRDVGENKCLGCHGDMDKLMKKTINADPNPHASPHMDPKEIPKCGDCHGIHRPSGVSCLQCHPEFKFNIK